MSSHADVSAEEKARRVRSLLSAYYTSGPEDAAGQPGGRSAASIDSAAFDADAYTSNLVRRHGRDAASAPLPTARARADVTRRVSLPRNPARRAAAQAHEA